MYKSLILILTSKSKMFNYAIEFMKDVFET